MNNTLKYIMGIREEPTQEKCAWRYKVEELIRLDKEIPERHRDCEDCSGFPVDTGCVSYTTLDHLENTYNLFRREN